MEWTQFLILSVTIGGLFLWNRSEANGDRRDIVNLILNVKSETNAQIDAIKNEMKDFHGRLERQDAEFRGRLEKQDAEFKMFMRAEEERRTQILMERSR